MSLGGILGAGWELATLISDMRNFIVQPVNGFVVDRLTCTFGEHHLTIDVVGNEAFG